MQRKTVIIAIRLFAVMTLLTGILYPLAVTVAGRSMFPFESGGSIVYHETTPAGSLLIAQPAADSGCFVPRPSAGNYSTVPSSASNLSLSNQLLRDSMMQMAKQWETTIHEIPSDLIFSSGSGLDPHLTPASARIQARRIARVRNFSAQQFKTLGEMIARRTEKPQFGFLGDERANVFLLNCDLMGVTLTKKR